jgi:hypothetical protein
MPEGLRATPAGADGSANTLTFADLDAVAAFSFRDMVMDSLGESHPIHLFFFKRDSNVNLFAVGIYAESDDVDPPVVKELGEPRLLSLTPLVFSPTGDLEEGEEFTVSDIPWNNGARGTQDILFGFIEFTSFFSNSNICKIVINGGIGGGE